MIRKLFVVVLFMLAVASSAVNAQKLTVTASNGSVAADVWNGFGYIDFFIPTSNPPDRISFPQHSYLTVLVGNKFYTNEPVSDYNTTAQPTGAYPPVELSNGSSILLKDKSGLMNDTIRTTWTISTPDSFQIIQDVYPVPFSISGSGQIVYKISIENLQNSFLPAQAQYLLDNLISTNNPSITNDYDTLATRAGYSPFQQTFPNAAFPGIPPFELAFENGLCSSTDFPGLIAVGYTNDSLAPEPMGLMTPLTLTFVDWVTIVENFVFGFDPSKIGTRYIDAATLTQWPASGASPNSENEIARGSFGTQQCQTCAGNLFGLIFHPEHIKWNGSNYTPNPFPVEAVIFDPGNSTLGSASATQTTSGPVKIFSPQPTTNGGYSQQHSTSSTSIQECALADIIWFDSVDNSLVDCTSDSIYDIQVSVSGSGVSPPIFLSPCICPIAVDCQHIQSISASHPLTSILSRTGSYDGSICNMRCTDVAAFDSGGIPGGIKSIVATSLTNMKLAIAPSHVGADTMFYTVCVEDSMENGSATITITDTSGNVDSEHYTYCTIPDTKAPLVQLGVCFDSIGGPCDYQVSDTQAWDRGLDTIYFTNVQNVVITPPDSVHARGVAGLSVLGIGSFCITAIDLAGNKLDTCFGSSASVSTALQPEVSLSISPNPAFGDVTIFLQGAPSANVEIFDILGREVDRFYIDGSYDWQTSGLPLGTYVLRAITGEPGENAQSFTKRIIKE